jgi:signal transduction histidine kinase
MFDASGDLADVYGETKDYKKALDYERLHYAYHDSLNNDKVDKHLQQLQFDYQLQKKENEIQTLDVNRSLAQSRNEKQRLVEWALVAGLALLVAIAVLLYRNAKTERKNRLEMQRQKEAIQHQAEELADLVKFKDKTFSVLSHDLRGPMGTLTTAMMMLDEFILSPADFAKIKPEINKQLMSLNTLLDNLLNWARASIQGSITTTPENTDLRSLVEKNAVLLKETAGRKNVKIDIAMNESSAYCDFGQLDIVTRNLISNAIKFTPAGGTVTVTSESSNNRTFLSVKDTGVGMTAEKVSKLFTVSSGGHTYGTEGEKGTGLGLLLCNDFIKSNGGAIRVESEVGKGSIFTVDLPAAKP